MAHSRDRENPASPRSSAGGAESFKGTPETRLTAFSPEDGSAKSSKLLQGLVRSSSATPPVGLPPGTYRGSAGHLDKDPFVTPSHRSESRLSPTASAFSPFANTISVPLPNNTGPLATGLSTDLGVSRHLDISSATSLTVSEVNSWLCDVEAHGDPPHGTRVFDSFEGHVYIRFSDIRDACSAYSSIRLAGATWQVEYADSGPAAQDDRLRHDSRLPYPAQVNVLAVVPQHVVADALQVTDVVQRLLQSHGRLFAFIKRSTFPNGSFTAVAEFCDISAVVPAVSSCNDRYTAEGLHIIVSAYDTDATGISDLTGALHGLALHKAPQSPARHIGGVHSALSSHTGQSDMRVQPQFAMYPLVFPSPFAANVPYMLEPFLPVSDPGPVSPMPPVSPSYPVLGQLFHTPPSPALTSHNSYSPSRPLSGFHRGDARRQNAMRVNRSPYHNISSHHNHVDISRIREGIDVRTTIMLRNIPNKVDQAMLKRIIDESSWGKYDFMYLRIDFANDCNVGYAFINFVDPLDIIDFVEARGNQRWNCFKSDKVAEISYATIQGKDCLVQKFRNSSVMLEAPHYRPKLYFTSNGPMPELAGQEEPFPEPDNQSKMKRSCENAEHVGLFTPNAGQHFRDEQRRRRSQYDRGTRLAALEEYDYEAAIQHMYGTTAQ
ncbi:meiosis protein MEI2 [Purpureocillium lilacinum]|uniref:Meiosis protein MEI2 n=2 Tax=Purpureocillium lilacinum TaxID=33203 RepID=A0A179GTG2_PURLI|nr:meiosis protein MEI2 [Purpureocillium lilacinum]